MRDDFTQGREPASRYHEEPRLAVSAVSAATPQGGMAELYAERQAGAGAASVVPAAVDTMGGMAELYREQQEERRGRDAGEHGK